MEGLFAEQGRHDGNRHYNNTRINTTLHIAHPFHSS